MDVRRSLVAACAAVGALAFALPAAAEFKAITPTMADKTIVLDGHKLTVQQVVDIARHGAKVRMAPEAMQMAADSYGLMLQAQLEGVTVYRFNRGAGQQREIVTMVGDPESEENKAILQRRFQGGGGGGGLEPEIEDEDTLRAMLAVNANIVVYEAASPGFVNGLVGMLNAGVYPAIASRGARGEADFVPAGATMSGRGFAWYKGRRMPAADALRQAGLTPVRLGGNDDALNTTSALTAGMAALFVEDARQFLEWGDLTYAMVLNGMNSSLTPMSMPVQTIRPFRWVNFQSARVMDMVRGGYLFNDDKARIVQDPESMRATPWRQGALWEAWADLRDDALIQMNSSDHNPTARPGVSPQDSWELSTPQFMKYYIKGGKYSNGKGGYIFSNSNWDPYPLVNKVEAFALALMNMDVITVQGINRFSDPFFTVVRAADVLPGVNGGGGGSVHWLWAEIKANAMPISPDGVWSGLGVADIAAVPLLKLDRTRKAMDGSRELLAEQMLVAAYWMDVRKTQDPSRTFGKAPTEAWTALRKIVPLRRDPAAPPPSRSNATLVAEFMAATPAATFYPGGPAMPGGAGDIPFAAPTKAR